MVNMSIIGIGFSLSFFHTFSFTCSWVSVSFFFFRISDFYDIFSTSSRLHVSTDIDQRTIGRWMWAIQAHKCPNFTTRRSIVYRRFSRMNGVEVNLSNKNLNPSSEPLHFKKFLSAYKFTFYVWEVFQSKPPPHFINRTTNRKFQWEK